MTEPHNQSHENELLEKAFELIAQGKSLKTEGDFWGAAESFLESRELLEMLASESPTESEEEIRIAKLYQAQCYEYFHRSRVSLIQAMEAEHQKDLAEGGTATDNAMTGDNDNESATTTPTSNRKSPINRNYFCQSLSDEEANKRIRLFSVLFAKETIEIKTLPIAVLASEEGTREIASPEAESVAVAAVGGGGGGESKDDSGLEALSSLEDRLSQLNASLPKGIKTPKERLQDINQGMKRLGMSVYNEGNNSTTNPLKVEPTKSMSQQVEDIIGQAKDEVAMGLVAPDDDGVSAASSHADDVISDDDYFSGDDGADSILSDEVPELQNVAKIQDQVAQAQAKLAELTAVLQTLPSPEDQEEAEIQREGKEDAPPFENVYAKKMLTDAKASVGKALKLWKVKPRS